MDNNGIQFTKINKNTYNVEFTINNNFINLPKLIDFPIIKLIFDLNQDIYEKTNLKIINNNEANIFILLKHFFQDVGLNQKYFCLQIKKTNSINEITFTCNTIKDYNGIDFPKEVELINVNDLYCKCNFISQNIVNFKITIVVDEISHLPQYIEKMIKIIFNKIITRVKQFIENLRM